MMIAKEIARFIFFSLWIFFHAISTPAHASSTLSASCPSLLSASPSSDDIEGGYEFLIRLFGDLLSDAELTSLISGYEVGSGKFFNILEKGGVRFGQFAEALRTVENLVLKLSDEKRTELNTNLKKITQNYIQQRNSRIIEAHQQISGLENLAPAVYSLGERMNGECRHVSFSRMGLICTHLCARFWSRPLVKESLSTYRYDFNNNVAASFHLHGTDAVIQVFGHELFWASEVENRFAHLFQDRPEVHSYAESADKEKLLFGRNRGRILVLDRNVLSRQSGSAPAVNRSDFQIPNERQIQALALLGKEGFLYVSSSQPSELKVWANEARPGKHFWTSWFKVQKIEADLKARYVLAIGSKRYEVLDTRGSSPVLIFEGVGKFPTLSPDGQWVVHVGKKHQLFFNHIHHSNDRRVLDAYSNPQAVAELKLDEPLGAFEGPLAFSPDGKSLALFTIIDGLRKPVILDFQRLLNVLPGSQ